MRSLRRTLDLIGAGLWLVASGVLTAFILQGPWIPSGLLLGSWLFVIGMVFMGIGEDGPEDRRPTTQPTTPLSPMHHA